VDPAANGHRERRWIEDGQTPADLAHAASLAALEDAGIEAGDLGCILLATLSPEHHFPGTSFFLQNRLGLSETPCIDLHAQCTGFLYSLAFADSLVQAGRYERVLVVGAEVHSTGLDLTTEGRDVSVIFGDGAGAVVVEANRDAADPGEILGIQLGAQGEHAMRLCVDAPASGSMPRITHEMLDSGLQWPHMDGRFVFKNAVRRMPPGQPADQRVRRQRARDPGNTDLQQHPAVRELLGRLDPDVAGRDDPRGSAGARAAGLADRLRLWLLLGQRRHPLVASYDAERHDRSNATRHFV